MGGIWVNGSSHRKDTDVPTQGAGQHFLPLTNPPAQAGRRCDGSHVRAQRGHGRHASAGVLPASWPVASLSGSARPQSPVESGSPRSLTPERSSPLLRRKLLSLEFLARSRPVGALAGQACF